MWEEGFWVVVAVEVVPVVAAAAEAGMVEVADVG